MEPHFRDDRCAVWHGDCLDVMREMAPDSVDAIVTDPPYGLEFMGAEWDRLWVTHPKGRRGRIDGKGGMETWGKTPQYRAGKEAQVWHLTWAIQALRVLRPGGYMVAFGGTRTSHRMVCAIEDAGFTIQDALVWLHGQGFPKGHSQLKPAHEPIVLARKGRGGALNIDGCRIEGPMDGTWGARQLSSIGFGGTEPTEYRTKPHEAGRWPANVVLSHSPECVEVGTKRVKTGDFGCGEHAGGRVYGQGRGFTADFALTGKRHGYADADGMETVPAWDCSEDCAVRLLDQQSGERPGATSNSSTRGANAVYSPQLGHPKRAGFADTGGASRFLYVAKASAEERGRGNNHPTVKPLALVSWLLKLVLRPGGTVLDPFAGSGTTGVAASRLGMRAVLIEQDAAYVALAVRRYQEDAPLFNRGVEPPA